MRLISLTALTMLAFAANSILTRMAIEGGHIDPSSFAAIRIVAGAVALAMILTVRGGGACHCLSARGSWARCLWPPI